MVLRWSLVVFGGVVMVLGLDLTLHLCMILPHIGGCFF